ncbi:carboxymuconolactone decarboxylase family protein [Paraburkholderia xenovorans LB400]|uniref:Carboxymuconolactone decarboxylase-like domain-containing protein n=1 Tax=Paraburkholderia xenovorans (strain LB400) TaxID=266265 RepID=Q13I56_PARXL|nr:carboxymuconolactone decarboxylase family protein [Paraburkholderia xenovorans]ABE36233.1 hypothetical protein Bxe_C0317 [Paraburkholderia xenovorans LB400]AIP34394.1 carboxymuconolactone decarboxylase family protein [Paraburkholderia xenovorans LB400]
MIPDSTLSIHEISAFVDAGIPPDTPPGEHLDPLTVEFIEYALRSSVTTLDTQDAEQHAQRALSLGATTAQLHEILLLVSALGVHSLMAGSTKLARLGSPAGKPMTLAPLTNEQQALHQKYVGESSYWRRFEEAIPGFLDSLLRFSPEGFEAFFNFCALPWHKATVPALTKELISIAVDATPSHRFLPGVRIHVGNALTLGCGRTALREVLAIAARAPVHSGVR